MTENHIDWEHDQPPSAAGQGPAANPAISALRMRQHKNFAAILLMSLGVAMLLAGDEVGRTQQGNNYAYCQDNEISWLD